MLQLRQAGAAAGIHEGLVWGQVGSSQTAVSMGVYKRGAGCASMGRSRIWYMQTWGWGLAWQGILGVSPWHLLVGVKTRCAGWLDWAAAPAGLQEV